MKYILAIVLFAVFTSVAVLSASAWWGSGGPEGWWFERSLPVGAKARGHQSVSAPEHPVRYGKHSERFEVKPGDCSESEGGGWDDCANDRERSEMTQRGTQQYHGDEYWYRWSILLPKGHTNIYPVKLSYAQFHQHDCQPAFMFHEFGGGYHLEIMRGIGRFGHKYVLASAAEFVGKWTDIVVHAKWSQGDDGWFKVWANGKQKVDYSGRTMTCHDVYFKYGIYRSFISRNPGPAGAVSTVAYFDGVVRSRSKEGMFDPLEE